LAAGSVPPQPLIQIPPGVELCLALDIGGTKLAAALADRDGGLSQVTRVPTPATNDPEELFSALTALVDRVSGGVGNDKRLVACGVGCGGPMTAGGEQVSPLNIPAWRGFPLRRRIAEHTGLGTAVDNDAKALALGEGWRGAARGRRDYLAMVVSTGVGGGIVLDGRLLQGTGGNAGHIGHVIVEPQGRPCTCGGRGCLEAEASGLAIAEMTGRPPAEASLDVIERTGRLVGRAVASVANLLDFQFVVVAGSVALGFGAPFFDAAQAQVDELARISFARGTRVVPAGLGAEGPLVGAAAVGWRAVGSAVLAEVT